MAESFIPVDLLNPGQLFACLGFLEAAEVVHGESEGRFDWTDRANVLFHLRTNSDENPFAAVLFFLAKAKLAALAPSGWQLKEAEKEQEEEVSDGTFPSPEPSSRFSLPVRITGPVNNKDTATVHLAHWLDGSSRNNFKLYAGKRSSLDIAKAMLNGTRDVRRKKVEGLKKKGLSQLWQEDSSALAERPFDVMSPIGGSFNFDPRGAWTAIDTGYSLNTQKHLVVASPVVEILAAWGLENARPAEVGKRTIQYAAWGRYLPPMLARAALCNRMHAIPCKSFRFTLALSGKNKIITFAKEEA